MRDFEKAWGPLVKKATALMPTSVTLHLHLSKARITKGPVFQPGVRSHFGGWYTFNLEVPAEVRGPGGSEAFSVTVEYAQEFITGAKSSKEYAETWKPTDNFWDAMQKDLLQRDLRGWSVRVLRHPLPKWLGADSSSRWNVA